MNIRDLVERALTKAGGVRPLSRELQDWNPASIVKARDDSKLSPFRAAQLARYLGEDETIALLAALLDTSRSSEETVFWQTFPQHLFEARDREVVKIAGHLHRKLAEEWAKRSEPPPADLQEAQFMQTLSKLLDREQANRVKTAKAVRKAVNE